MLNMQHWSCICIIRSWHGNAVCIIGPLCRESTGYWWIPRTMHQQTEPLWGHFVVSFKKLFNKASKSILDDDKNLFSLHSHYHGCWWLGDTRSQGISSHGIEQIISEHPSFNILSVKNNSHILMGYSKKDANPVCQQWSSSVTSFLH